NQNQTPYECGLRLRCLPPGTFPSETLKGRDRTSSKRHHSKKSSDKVIVRLVTKNRMVTKGYQEGVYERVTKGTRGKWWQKKSGLQISDRTEPQTPTADAPKCHFRSSRPPADCRERRP